MGKGKIARERKGREKQQFSNVGFYLCLLLIPEAVTLELAFAIWLPLPMLMALCLLCPHSSLSHVKRLKAERTTDGIGTQLT